MNESRAPQSEWAPEAVAAQAEHETTSDVSASPPPSHRGGGNVLDVLLISGAVLGLLVMGFAWLGVEHDKKWAEARRVLIETHAELERRLIEDRNEWEANQRRRIRQLQAEQPDGSDAEEMKEWEEELQAAREREYDRDVRRVLHLENGDRVLLNLEWQDTLRYFRRGYFRFYAGGNRPSEESGHNYFLEVVGEPDVYGDEDGLETPEGVLRIYSDGTVVGPLPLSEATEHGEEE